MCGFLFYFSKSKKYNKKKFLLSSKLIEHRGPDDYSDYFDNEVAVSFYRLSIRDLSLNGRQPMFSKSKSYLMVFNGEIYNSSQLKKNFNLKNVIGTSDTEILLEFIEKYGVEKIKYVKGMYSVIIYDLQNKKILAFRDRFGIKPLYYYESDNYVIFSSEIKPILKYSNFCKIDDSSMLSFFLKGEIENNGYTLFKNIKSLEAANYLKLSKTKLSTSCYWKLEHKINRDNLKNTKKELLSKLKESVKSHSISDKKLGIFLSGGTDSSSLAKILRKNEKNFATFTYDFSKNNSFSELEKAKKISKKLKLKNFHCSINPNFIIKNFENIVRVIESPITSIRLFGVMKLYSLAKVNGYDVILEGHGGDEMLGGYNYNYLFNIFSKNSKKKINKMMNDFFDYCNFNPKKILNSLITITNQAGSTTDGTPFVYIDLLNKDFVNENITKIFDTDKKLFKIKNFLLRSQYNDIKNLKIPRVLKYTDRLSMYNSVEARVPFLDHELFQFCYSLPNDLKFKKDVSRWIFKESTKNLNLNLNFTKKKKHIVDPQTEWFKKDLKEFFMDTLNSNSFKNLYYFNNKQIKSHYEKFIKGEIPTSFNLLQIFSAYYFLKAFKN